MIERTASHLQLFAPPCHSRVLRETCPYLFTLVIGQDFVVDYDTDWDKKAFSICPIRIVVKQWTFEYCICPRRIVDVSASIEHMLKVDPLHEDVRFIQPEDGIAFLGKSDEHYKATI